MKLLRQIVLSILLTSGVFAAVIYTSCTKDACKGVTCLNGGICSGGTCNCNKPGIGGVNCEIVYRKFYAFPYYGMVHAVGNLDSLRTVDSNIINNGLIFNAGSDTVDYNNMSVNWNDSARKLIVNLPLKLKNNNVSGSDFVIDSVHADTFTYSGYGSITTANASMTLTRWHPHGSSKVIFTFNSFTRQ